MYKAKSVYKNYKMAMEYERERFKSLKGKIVNHLELNSMLYGLSKLQFLMDRTPVVLDAPSGTGRLSLKLISKGYRVISADISLEMILMGEDIRHLRNYPLFLGYVIADLEYLPFRTESLDAVTSLRLFGHLPLIIKKRVLSEFKRVARSGAVVMFALHNSFLKVKLRLLQSIRLKPKTDMWFPISYNEIKRLELSGGWNFKYTRQIIPGISESIMCVFRGAVCPSERVE